MAQPREYKSNIFTCDAVALIFCVPFRQCGMEDKANGVLTVVTVVDVGRSTGVLIP